MVWVVIAILVVIGGSALVVAIGARLPKEHVVSRKAVFNRQPSEIWGVIADLGNQASWRTDLQRVDRVPDRNGHPVWEETDRRGQTLTMETVESLSSRRLVRRIADENLGFGGSWTMEIGEYGEVTSLTITENGEIHNPVFRFVSRFITGQSATIDEYLTALGAKLGVEVTITSA